MNQFPSKNYFTLPNEIFSLGLGAGEIAVYAYLRCLENPSSSIHNCHNEPALFIADIGVRLNDDIHDFGRSLHQVRHSVRWDIETGGCEKALLFSL